MKCTSSVLKDILETYCYLSSVYKTERRKERREKGEVGGGVYSIGICDSERVLRDEKERRDKKDNRGESKVKALVCLSNGWKKLLFLVLHSVRN